MSIATEIERLQNAKSSIKTAIESKGVSVGDGTIDTFAEKILEITGSPYNITAINGGTFKLDTLLAEGTFDVIHGLSNAPDAIIITSDVFDINPPAYNLGYMFYEKMSSTSGFSLYYNNSITSRINNVYDTISNGITLVDDNKFTITTASNRRLGAGVTYSWVAISFTPNTEIIPPIELDRCIKTINLISLNSLGRKEVILNLDNITSLGNFAQVSSAEYVNNTVEHLTLNVKNKLNSMAQMLYCHSSAWDKTLKHLTLNVDTSEVTTWNLTFNNQRTLEIIDGKPLDFTSATNVSNTFGYCNVLIEVRFVEGSIFKSISLVHSAYLSDETIESLAKGLADLTGSDAQTLTVHEDEQVKIQDNSTLLTLITSKNWTLA